MNLTVIQFSVVEGSHLTDEVRVYDPKLATAELDFTLYDSIESLVSKIDFYTNILLEPLHPQTVRLVVQATINGRLTKLDNPYLTFEEVGFREGDGELEGWLDPNEIVIQVFATFVNSVQEWAHQLPLECKIGEPEGDLDWAALTETDAEENGDTDYWDYWQRT